MTASSAESGSKYESSPPSEFDLCAALKALPDVASDKVPTSPTPPPPAAPEVGDCQIAACEAIAAYNQRFGTTEKYQSLLGCNSTRSFYKADILLTSGRKCSRMIITFKPGGDPAYMVRSLGSCSSG